VDKKFPPAGLGPCRIGAHSERRLHESSFQAQREVASRVSFEDLVLPPDLARRLERIGFEFLADVLEIEVARRPGNDAALGDLGHVLTRLGRNARALEVDRELARRSPEDDTVHYNLACSLALLGHVDEAFAALERACELGYDDADHAEEDEDLAALRDEERFHALLARLRTAHE
jgi:tetratricopeptide (TPR) repeat protein